MTERLPTLMDNRAIREEFGITEAAADKIMRQLEAIRFDGVRKLYVRRADVLAHYERARQKTA